MDLNQLGEKVIATLKPFLTEKQPELTTERCCIYLTPSKVQIIHLNKTDDHIEVYQTKEIDYADKESLSLTLSSFVKQYNLDSVPTYWLLSPEEYQLFLLDALPVSESELESALTWRMRSLVSYPVQDTAMGYFFVPAKKTEPDHPMIGVVIANKSPLTKTLALLKKSGLTVSVIDVPEMALKNLSDLYEEDEKCTAFIYFGTTSVLLNITREKTLYFSRHISLTNTELNDEQFSKVSLEIRRYFDYFQNQWRHPAPSRIFVSSDAHDDDMIARQLGEKLLAEIGVFSLKTLIDDEELKTKLEKHFLLTFGSGLRKGQQHVPTRD